MATSFPTKEQALGSRAWLVIDGQDQVVGRLASRIAQLLRGKHKANFTPHNDVGDFVIVLNADKIRFTGAKELDKRYYRHTGYVGGIKEQTPAELRAKQPERIIKKAVKGMLPSTTLGRAQLTKLKIYTGSEHPHMAQKPKVVAI